MAAPVPPKSWPPEDCSPSTSRSSRPACSKIFRRDSGFLGLGLGFVCWCVCACVCVFCVLFLVFCVFRRGGSMHVFVYTGCGTNTVHTSETTLTWPLLDCLKPCKHPRQPLNRDTLHRRFSSLGMTHGTCCARLL